MTRVIEETIQTPVQGEYDVIVCGGGPAGIGAAVAAARLGLRTLLLERYGFLGGMWTAGLVTPIFDAENKGGIVAELLARLRREGNLGGLMGASCNLEALKVTLDKLCLEANVALLFHTLVVGVVKEGEKVRGVIVENKSGRQAFLGRVIIDCTGDADVAARAGAPFRIGDPPHHTTQAMTTMLKLQNVRVKQRAAHELYQWLEEGRKQDPTYEIHFRVPWLIDCPDGSAVLQYVHVRGRSALEAQELSQAEVEGREKALAAYQFLRRHVQGFADAVLSQIAPQIGVRESRRVLGEHYLTETEMGEGKTLAYADATFICTFNIDVHEESSQGQTCRSLPPYTIPYRCLVPLGVENLLVAGRCISGSRLAMAAYRVTGNCLAMGQVAGTAAFLALERGETLRRLPYAELRRSLAQQGMRLAGA